MANKTTNPYDYYEYLDNGQPIISIKDQIKEKQSETDLQQDRYISKNAEDISVINEKIKNISGGTYDNLDMGEW
jgi:hypothetical protein